MFCRYVEHGTTTAREMVRVASAKSMRSVADPEAGILIFQCIIVLEEDVAFSFKL
jgi:hypothetical protein